NRVMAGLLDRAHPQARYCVARIRKHPRCRQPCPHAARRYSAEDHPHLGARKRQAGPAFQVDQHRQSTGRNRRARHSDDLRQHHHGPHARPGARDCSFYDPYIGEDAGYLQVTRFNGHGPALLVIPDGHTPFEAYKPILNPEWHRTPGQHGHFTRPGPQLFRDLTPRSITFEGFYDWMVHSEAYQQNEWKKAQPWNPATSTTIQPGQSQTYALRFLLSDTIPDIEKALAANDRPVAVGVPGYILPTDIQAHLFLEYPQPVKSITVEPAGAIAITRSK